ncbi:hypothetical protein LTR10_017729 [Elasticomyces elasticus]|uniref:Ubiquitin-like domain-containing protein n=1 Tax=Exophiala sideris TaxID=1016849 RepID=A0ABR0JC40_9EURO|nr:hypothetical protein LTR10_017729 [Elasticomyces elasticus]KAK5031020.1 hypothetical protein LTS07_004755 [Exophiala sideris]KAK5038742.1 hypothetical protein LTR13_003773 [Exophiala sideris]KAK5060625.1 hypothetical protein LTR69_005224 [Exophiala sideris]KAK5183538.1 hypothetical protein LTR44_003820 [Eurotiomycetes sp. CCFEE 6388]
MDNNSDTSAAPAQQPFSESASIPPDHVALRVTYMVTGNPRPPHSLGILPLSTSIATLKDKIKDELPEHPTPAEQRLIYQGRPLLRTDATLRDVLRIEVGSAPGPLPYTIHIVIQPGVQAPASTNGPNTVTNRPPPPPVPTVHPNHHIDHLRAVEASATILQESLSRIQQQIETNRADLLSVQQRISMNHQPASALQAALNGQPFPGPVPMHLPHGQHHAPPAPVWMQPPNASTPSQSQNVPPTSAQASQQNPDTATPSTGPSQPNIQAFQGPHGERVTVIRNHMNVPLPLQRPASTPGQPQAPPTAAPQNIASQHLPPTFPRNIPMPFQLPAPPHLPLPFPQARPLQARTFTSTPTAWILSSPGGPQAFLFAPGHGLFSNGQPTQSATRHALPDAAPTLTSPPPTNQQQPPAPVNQNGNVQNALIGPAQQPGQAPVAQIQQNAENNDLFNFLIHRGWLFLRLYLFMFVFSEPGTWKRWAMILIAAIVCLQPRDGPFVRAIRVARRHLDNLIGPPARPQAQPAAARQRPADNTGNAENNRAGQRPINVRGAVQMTPEEAAARLVREHREQNPSFWRDTFYRVEQSMALFLASLVPGVGERHIQAREEVRREAQRVEEERRRAQQEALEQVRAAAADTNQADEGATGAGTTSGTEVKVDQPAEPSTSTSVQVNDSSAEAGELRNRTT